MSYRAAEWVEGRVGSFLGHAYPDEVIVDYKFLSTHVLIWVTEHAVTKELNQRVGTVPANRR